MSGADTRRSTSQTLDERKFVPCHRVDSVLHQVHNRVPCPPYPLGQSSSLSPDRCIAIVIAIVIANIQVSMGTRIPQRPRISIDNRPSNRPQLRVHIGYRWLRDLSGRHICVTLVPSLSEAYTEQCLSRPPCGFSNGRSSRLLRHRHLAHTLNASCACEQVRNFSSALIDCLDRACFRDVNDHATQVGRPGVTLRSTATCGNSLSVVICPGTRFGQSPVFYLLALSTTDHRALRDKQIAAEPSG
ncbi:hypothetical protein V1525DRAFT_116711 [Lipomyces kononenkoae]|uniref:Uncharacterized protein n=1 Tax=Lipomyces kononenkoae TaxID=34357 RepID=A0ACC3T3Q9_LIPKO